MAPNFRALNSLDITGSPSSSGSVDNESLIGDVNELSISRDRKWLPRGMQGSLTLNLPRARLVFRAAVEALPSSVWDAHCSWVGRFEENLQFSVLASFYRYPLLEFRFVF